MLKAFAFTASAVLACSAAQAGPDDQLVSRIESQCRAEAEAAYEVARNAPIELIGKFGGNISNQLVQDLDAAKGMFVYMRSSECQLELIRRLNISTPY